MRVSHSQSAYVTAHKCITRLGFTNVFMSEHVMTEAAQENSETELDRHNRPLSRVLKHKLGSKLTPGAQTH